MTTQHRTDILDVMNNIEAELNKLDDIMHLMSFDRDKYEFSSIGWVRENAVIRQIDAYKSKVVDAGEILKRGI